MHQKLCLPNNNIEYQKFHCSVTDCDFPAFVVKSIIFTLGY